MVQFNYFYVFYKTNVKYVYFIAVSIFAYVFKNGLTLT